MLFHVQTWTEVENSSKQEQAPLGLERISAHLVAAIAVMCAMAAFYYDLQASIYAPFFRRLRPSYVYSLYSAARSIW